MRWLALAPCLAATGCNWVFGLGPTVSVDAPLLELPPDRTQLVWAIATTDGMPAAPGVDPTLEYTPIGSESARPMRPTVQVGDERGLSDVAYSVDDGTFQIPFDLRDVPHRVVYTLPGESVPHEWQWSVPNGIITVPRTTRADSPAPPTNSGYKLTPNGMPQLVGPVLVTSGAFSYSLMNPGVDAQQSGSTLSYRYSQYAKPFLGPLGTPDPAKGDWELLGEFESQAAGQRSALSGWAMASLELAANTLATPAMEPQWTTTKRTLSTLACSTTPADCLPAANATPTQQRLTAVLGAGTMTQHLSYGVSPSTELPGFVPGVAPDYIDQPVLLAFVNSSNLDSSFTFADPSGALALERVIAMRVGSSRAVNGATLTSTIQAITNSFTGTLAFPAPLATNVMLGSTNLSGATDAVPLPASSGVLMLHFVPEATRTADDYVVTLYELTGSSLAPLRVYHVLTADVKVDANLLVSGHHYAFGITARNGLPDAVRGDYRKAQYPFASTTTFPRTFIVQ
jgi:hypothetical protein